MKRLQYVSIGLIFFVLAACNEPAGKEGNANAETASSVKNISYSIIKTYPHDTASFTQGLVVYKGDLYEGTGGSKGNEVSSQFSRLMRVDLKTGKAMKDIKLDHEYFGEGVTVLHDTVYQLTWKNKVVFVYTLPDLKKVKEFPINTDGWGITTDGKELIVSDGSSNLYYYEPGSFKLLRTQSVMVDNEYLSDINELEYINGYVYANQWQRPYIFKIDPSSGFVVGRIDLTQAWERVKNIDPLADVPNGIAYDNDTKKIYITGKKWPELYEVQFGE
ncbi:MAG: glutaminyl-peptide cyclotransferase [Niabella sp.]